MLSTCLYHQSRPHRLAAWQPPSRWDEINSVTHAYFPGKLGGVRLAASSDYVPEVSESRNT
eukprot:2128570-Pyramimonas_sp.AAC.1